LHATFVRVAPWRRPSEDDLIATLGTGQTFSALWNSLNRRQGRAAFSQVGAIVSAQAAIINSK